MTNSSRLTRVRTMRSMVDVVAMNTFSLAIAIPLELGSARLSFHAFLSVRAIALITNTLTGRLYGLWRDYVIRRLCTHSSGRIRVYIADTLTFALFQLPVYCANLIIGGHATLSQLARSALPVTVLAGVIGGPYGWYLGWLRRRFGLYAHREDGGGQ